MSELTIEIRTFCRGTCPCTARAVGTAGFKKPEVRSAGRITAESLFFPSRYGFFCVHSSVRRVALVLCFSLISVVHCTWSRVRAGVAKTS